MLEKKRFYLIKYLFLLLIALYIQADETLNRAYYTDSNAIKLNLLIPKANPEIILFNIPRNKHSLKVKSKYLLKILSKYGYKDYKNNSNYISFTKKSPIDTSIIKLKIKDYFKEHYEHIDIHKVVVEPRAYMTSLPEDFSVEIKSKNYLKKDGILSIKTNTKKRIFFNYSIYAHVNIYKSSKDIKRKEALSAINTRKNSIILDNFKAKPIQKIGKSSLQSKHHIPKGQILSVRDVQMLSLIRKKSIVNINFNRDNMSISFSAKALDDGKLGDTIRVIKSNGKKIKVKVTGKNTAEIQ